MHNESSSFLYTKKGPMNARHLSLWVLVGTLCRKGRASRCRSPHLPLCNCLFHRFLWMKDFSKEFYSVLSASAPSRHLSCIMHAKKKKYSPFCHVGRSHCKPGFNSLSFLTVMQLMPHNHCAGGVRFSYFCMSVWKGVIIGKEWHQVLKDRALS